MSLIEILLSGIFIMQIITFHVKADSYGHYLKFYDMVRHRFPMYLGHYSCVLCNYSIKQGGKLWLTIRSSVLEKLIERVKRG